jgi:hypothetical protein
MIIIKCVNPKCSAPDGKFKWDEHPSLESDGKVAKQSDQGAASFVAECPCCGAENKIWLVKIKREDIIIKRPQNGSK